MIPRVCHQRCLALATISLFAACSRGNAPSDNAKRLVASARVEPIFANSDSAPLFGMIGGLDLGVDGSLLVSEVRDARVSAYSSDGELLYAIDSRGEGPGDLQSPCCAVLVGSDSLWVYDLGNRRFDLFLVGSGQPRILRSIPSGASGYFTFDRLQLAVGGGVYHLTTAQAGPSLGSLVIELLDSAGVVAAADTLVADKATTANRIEIEVPTSGGTARYHMAVPFGPRQLFALGPAGTYATSSNQSDTVLVRRLGGDTVALISRTIDSVLVSKLEADSAAAAIAEWAKSLGVSSTTLDYQPRVTKAPLVGLGYDAEGRLWVEHSVADGAPASADLYSADGSFLESRSWPGNVRLVSWASRGATAIGMQTAPTGEQTLVRLVFAPEGESGH